MTLGVYLLGALEPDERAELEAHLQTCSQCRHELDELAALPSMLDRLGLEDVELLQAAGSERFGSLGTTVTPPEDLFDRFVARARDDEAAAADLHAKRGPSRRLRLLSAAAAMVVVFAGVGVGVAELHNSHPPKGVTVTNGGVSMHVTLASQATGTGLRVSVSGLPDNEHCRLIAIGKDGVRDVAGQWAATYSGHAQVTGSTSIPISDLSQLVLLGTNGKPLVTASV
jgi:hypothetical protein